MNIFYCIAGFSLLVTLFFIIWQEENKPFLSLVMKSAASFCFVVLALFNILLNDFVSLGTIFILIGLVASIFGDVFLAGLEFKTDFKGKIILSGMIAFSVAQLFYFFGMAVTVNFAYFYISILAGLAIALVIVFGEKLLKLNYGKLKPIVGIYSFFLATSLVQSLITAIQNGFNAFSTLLFIGLVFFFVSDLILSFIYFSQKPSRKLVYPNLAFYYIAQILIASSIMFF